MINCYEPTGGAYYKLFAESVDDRVRWSTESDSGVSPNGLWDDFDTGIEILSTNYYWMRVLQNDSGMYIRFWEDGTSEPSSWNGETTSLSCSGDSYFGFISKGDTPYGEIDYVQILTPDTNTAPTAPTSLTPITGSFADTVNIACSGSTDVDNDIISYTIQSNITGSWSNLITSDTDGLYSWNVSAYGENSSIDIRCFASDIYTNGSIYNPSGTINIDNVAPRLDNAGSNHTTAHGDVVLFNVTFTDPNLDTCIFEYYNGSSWSNTTNASCVSGQTWELNKTMTGIRDDMINWSWYANDTANNINHTGYYNFTLNNAPPQVDSLIINSSDGSNSTAENISVFISSSDGDGDIVYDITDWRVEGVSIAALNMPFDINSTSVAKDYSTFGNNGTLGNGNIIKAPNYQNADCIVGGCYLFDGLDDYIEVPYDTSLVNNETNEMTVSFWVKPNYYPVGVYTELLRKSNSFVFTRVSTGDYDIAFFNTTNKPQKPSVLNNIPSSVIPIGSWTKITLVTNGSLVALYQNGTKIYSKVNTPFTLGETTVNLAIGSYEGGGMRFFNGSIDEVKIFNRELSADQIYQDYLDDVAGKHLETIVSNDTGVGENWSVVVTSTDGYDDGTPATSSSLEVLPYCIIQHNYTMTESQTCSELYVYPGISLTTGSNTLTVTGNTTINGTLNATGATMSTSGLTLNSGARLYAPTIMTTTSGVTIQGTFSNNNGVWNLSGSGSADHYFGDTTFYDLIIDDTIHMIYQDFRVLHSLNFTADGSILTLSGDRTIVLGSSTYSATVNGASGRLDPGTQSFTTAIESANTAYPVIFNTDAINWDNIYGTTSLVEVRGVDYQVATTTGGGGASITATGDSRFTDLTISSGDSFSVSTGMDLYADSIAVVGTFNVGNGILSKNQNTYNEINLDSATSYSFSDTTISYGNNTGSNRIDVTSAVDGENNVPSLLWNFNTPGTALPTISPSTVYADSLMMGNCTVSDSDGDLLNYYWKWYKNGVEYSSGSSSGKTQGVEINLANISSSLTTVGETWTFECFADDGMYNGTAQNASELIIECSVDGDCSLGECIENYCFSNPGQFAIKNSAGEKIIVIDNTGLMAITGTLSQSCSSTPGLTDFVINSSGGVAAWFDDRTGNVCIQGSLSEQQTSFSPNGDDWLIANSTMDYVAMVDGTTGNLLLRRNIITGAAIS